MAGQRVAPQIALTADERVALESRAARRKTAHAMSMRARIVLASAD